jgi:FkbM family methyltransferase
MNSAVAVTALALASLAGQGCHRNSSPPESVSRKDILRTEKNRHSQHGEELVIRDFFQDRRNGIFVDVGCAWPVKYSNTYYLEKELGWTGIGVDALPDYESRWRNRRPRSKFFNFIVTDRSDTVETFYRTVDRDLLGISSLFPENPGRRSVEHEEIQVPTITLNRLLELNGLSKFDLFSMDIEGAEEMALKGFDVERFRPELAIVEIHSTTREAVMAFFRSHGYHPIDRYIEFDYANYYFTRDPER